MLPFFLYLVAGLVTGFHVYRLVLASYGDASNVLAVISLLGSFCFLIAAYLSLFKPYAASRMALVAALAIWCFYGPAIASLVRMRVAKPAVVSERMRPPAAALPDSSLRPPRIRSYRE